MTPRDAHPVILFDDLKEEIERGGNIELVLPARQPDDGVSDRWRVFLETKEGVRHQLVRPKTIRPYEIKTPKGLFNFLRSLGITQISVPVPTSDSSG